jgi:hypothetical protein
MSSSAVETFCRKTILALLLLNLLGIEFVCGLIISRQRRGGHLSGPFPCELERHCPSSTFCCKYDFINLLTQAAVVENLTKIREQENDKRLVVDFNTPKTFTVRPSLYPNLNNISFALFAQFQQRRHNNGTILWKGLLEDPNLHPHYELSLDSNLGLSYNSESAEQISVCLGEQSLADNKTWHTILAVFDRGLRSLKVYLDGQDKSTTCKDESNTTILGSPLVDDPKVSLHITGVRPI